MNFKVSAILVLLGLALSPTSTPVFATTLVDTGAGASSGGLILDADQFLGGQFTLAGSYRITDVAGWMATASSAGSYQLTAALYGTKTAHTGYRIPDAANRLFSQSFSSTFTAFEAGWHGVSGLSLDLAPGTYWLAFEVAPGDDFVGNLPGSAPSPLGNYAFASTGFGWSSLEPYSVDKSMGFRVMGDESTPVPEPSTLLMSAAGLAGMGMALKYRRNSKNPLPTPPPPGEGDQRSSPKRGEVGRGAGCESIRVTWY